jgi:hypothetical protein
VDAHLESKLPSADSAVHAVNDSAYTRNIPSDLTLPQIASIREALTIPIDFYIEAPDNIGGFIRYYELADIIRVAAAGVCEVWTKKFTGYLPLRHSH